AFEASAKDLGYKNPQGKEVYRFELSPEENSVPGGLQNVAVITFIMSHPTFANPLLAAGPDRNFRASYPRWGCLRRVVAVLEYTDSDKPPTIASFDMCKALGWE